MPRKAESRGSGNAARLVVAAAQSARLDELKLLLKGGADPNAVWRGYRPLHALIQERPHGERSRRRRGCGASPGFSTTVRIPSSSVRGLRRELKKNPAFATTRDGGSLTALQCCAASRMGRHDAGVTQRLLEIARALMDAGADPGTKTRSWDHDLDAVSLAVGAHNANMVKLFLARGADATEALASAAWSQTEELLEISLAHGATVNRARVEGRPILNEMVRWGRSRMVSWLLRHGADPNIPDERGWNAMHQAASRGNVRMWNELLAAGGDLARADRAGLTPPDLAHVKRVVKIAKAIASAR